MRDGEVQHTVWDSTDPCLKTVHDALSAGRLPGRQGIHLRPPVLDARGGEQGRAPDGKGALSPAA